VDDFGFGFGLVQIHGLCDEMEEIIMAS